MMELDAQLGAVLVHALGEGAHGLDVIVVAHGQLREGGRAAHIVDPADTGDDEANAALCPLLEVVHHVLRGLPLGCPRENSAAAMTVRFFTVMLPIFIGENKVSYM